MTPAGWRVFAAAVGAAALGWGLFGKWRAARTSRWAVGIIAGTLVALAAHPGWADRLATLPHMIRIRLIMGIVSVLVMVVNVEAIRRSRLRERYALLWIGTSLFILAGALFTGWLDRLSAALGMQYVSIIVAVIFVFLLLVAFQFSVEISRLNEDRARLARRLALLETKWEMQKVGPSTEQTPADASAPTDSRVQPPS